MLAHQGRGYFGTTFARVWDVFSPSSPSFFWKSHGEVISWQFWTNTRRTRRSADGVFQLDSTSSASKCRRRPARAVPLPPPAPPPPPPPARSGHIFFRVELLIPVLRTRTAGCQILNLRAGSGWSCARRRREVGSIRSQRGSGAAGCCRLNAVGGTSQLLFLIPRDFPTFKSYICAPPPHPPPKKQPQSFKGYTFYTSSSIHNTGTTHLIVAPLQLLVLRPSHAGSWQRWSTFCNFSAVTCFCRWQGSPAQPWSDAPTLTLCFEFGCENRQASVNQLTAKAKLKGAL